MVKEKTTEARLAAIKALPGELQDFALVGFDVAAKVMGLRDPQHAKTILIRAGVPLVAVSDRRRLPTWRALKEYLRACEAPAQAEDAGKASSVARPSTGRRDEDHSMSVNDGQAARDCLHRAAASARSRQALPSLKRRS